MFKSQGKEPAEMGEVMTRVKEWAAKSNSKQVRGRLNAQGSLLWRWLELEESPLLWLQEALGSESTRDEEEPRESGTSHKPSANRNCSSVVPFLSQGFTGRKKKTKNGGRRLRLARGQVGGAIRSQRRADKSYQSLHHSD